MRARRRCSGAARCGWIWRCTRAQGTGITGQGAILTLPLLIQQSLAGKVLSIEVSAVGDAGNADPFVQAGTITVAGGGIAAAGGGPKPNNEDEVRPLTETQRHQRARTNQSGLDDDRTEGDVLAVRCNARPPRGRHREPRRRGDAALAPRRCLRVRAYRPGRLPGGRRGEGARAVVLGGRTDGPQALRARAVCSPGRWQRRVVALHDAAPRHESRASATARWRSGRARWRVARGRRSPRVIALLTLSTASRLPLVAGVNSRQHLSRLNRVADRAEQLQADRVVDRVALARPAGPESVGGQRDRPSARRRRRSRPIAPLRRLRPGGRQQARIVERRRVAALRLHDLAQLRQPDARRERRQRPARGRPRLDDATPPSTQHLGRHRRAQAPPGAHRRQRRSAPRSPRAPPARSRRSARAAGPCR